MQLKSTPSEQAAARRAKNLYSLSIFIFSDNLNFLHEKKLKEMAKVWGF